MKKTIALLLLFALLLTGCDVPPAETTTPATTVPAVQGETGIVSIALDGDTVYVEDDSGVSVANDIIYYEAGRDFTYGEGGSEDAHSAEQAAAHQVIHITRPGTYRISGTLSLGQIAVDLGEDAKNDPNAVVTLILDNADITCQVAPAIIFYNVYECGSDDPDTAGAVVDTSAAGANVVIADGSVNTVRGSCVAKIYKPDSVVLSKDGTEVEDAKKLHKYDAAFYSKMSMNIFGGEKGDGILNIHGENEGLGTELHLTLNGGSILIDSGNDGINTNEDGVSVTTVNGGHLTIRVNGSTGEGDGIDSNGWLVINGGTVIASACGFSADAGIDSDMGIHINGGTVIASGHMLDQIRDSAATYAIFQFTQPQKGGQTYTLKNEAEETVLECTPTNDFTCLILSGDALTPGTYHFWQDETLLSGAAGIVGGPGFFGGMEGNVGIPGDMPGKIEGGPPDADFEIPPQPGGQLAPQGGQTPPPPQSDLPPADGGQRPQGTFGQNVPLSEIFVIVAGGNQFIQVGPVV